MEYFFIPKYCENMFDTFLLFSKLILQHPYLHTLKFLVRSFFIAVHVFWTKLPICTNDIKIRPPSLLLWINLHKQVLPCFVSEFLPRISEVKTLRDKIGKKKSHTGNLYIQQRFKPINIYCNKYIINEFKVNFVTMNLI